VQENGGANTFWTILVTIGGIFGIWNIVKAFNEPDEVLIAEYKRVIAEKDKIIKEYERQIERLLDNDSRKDLE